MADRQPTIEVICGTYFSGLEPPLFGDTVAGITGLSTTDMLPTEQACIDGKRTRSDHCEGGADCRQ